MLHRKDLNVPSFEPSWSCCRPKSFTETHIFILTGTHNVTLPFTRLWSLVYLKVRAQYHIHVLLVRQIQSKWNHRYAFDQCTVKTGNVFLKVSLWTQLPIWSHLISRETDKLQQLECSCGQHRDHLWGHFKVRAAGHNSHWFERKPPLGTHTHTHTFFQPTHFTMQINRLTHNYMKPSTLSLRLSFHGGKSV